MISADIPFNKRILFLPHCLRNNKICKNEYDENGLICQICSNNCAIGRLKKFAQELGYHVCIAPGGSMVVNIIEKEKPLAVVGVACRKEIEIAEKYLKIPYNSVELSKDGCINTEVDEEEVKKTLKC